MREWIRRYGWLLCGWLSACSFEEQLIETKPAQALYFSADSVYFDTLISHLRSTSYIVRLHNPNKKAVLLERIWLARGVNSPYTCWINGQKGKSFEAVQLLGQDSLLLVIEVSLTGNSHHQYTKEEDKLWVQSVAGMQQLPLKVWGKDAIYTDTLRIDVDTHWKTGPARSIGKILHVQKGITLHIAPGTQIFFAPEASMYVAGRLLANGTAEQPIVFTSQRQDGAYKETPGQWAGIRFAPNQEESILKYVVISNAKLGIRLGEATNRTGSKLRMGHAIVRHMSQGGLLSYGGHTFIYNTLMHHAKLYLATHYGGSHRYFHCTLSNTPSRFLQNDPPIQVADYLPAAPHPALPLQLYIDNSILWGDLNETLQIDAKKEKVRITNSLLRTQHATYLNEGDNLLADEDNFPAFVEAKAYNYKLKEHSPARDRGKIRHERKEQQKYDLRGNKRHDNKPDIGAYEWVQRLKSTR